MREEEAIYCMKSYLPGDKTEHCIKCPYYGSNNIDNNLRTCKSNEAHEMAIKAIEQKSKTDKALNLLAEWAIECGFGYDNIPEEYEKYKDDIADMGYVEGLVYIVKMESEVNK